jgi:AcrR family transcriptional regulator
MNRIFQKVRMSEAMKNHRTELLHRIRQYFSEHSLNQASAVDICRHCHISTRTFYNYFYDKYDAASRIVLEQMHPFIAAPLGGWHEELADFIIAETKFFYHCIENTDSNPFLKTMKRMEYEKLTMHIPAPAMDDPEQAPRIRAALLFFTHGLIGTIYTSVIEKEEPINEETFNTLFDNNWDVVKEWIPGILKKSLTEKVQKETSPVLSALIIWKCDR